MTTQQTTTYKPSLDKGQVKTISKAIDVALSPAELFAGIDSDAFANNRMLLESSEIDSKENVKSILMLQAALRIECNGLQVSIIAQTSNGEVALTEIARQMAAQGQLKVASQNTRELTIDYPQRPEGLDEDARLKTASPIDALRSIQQAFQAQSHRQFAVFLCGLFAFDFIASFEKLEHLEAKENTCPDYVFYLAETLLVIDHQSKHSRLFSNLFSGAGVTASDNNHHYFELSRQFENFEQRLVSLMPPLMDVASIPPAGNSHSEPQVDIDDLAFARQVTQLKQNIIAGDVFQVVPSRTFNLACQSPLQSYRQLKRLNPSPYLFFMQDQAFTLFGASPESALKYNQHNRQVELYPIAGTRPRGKNTDGQIDLDLDARIEAELKLDKKELSEHMMLVDLARNDIARIAAPGTTHVPKLLAVDRYSQVMHLVSCVRGELKKDLDVLHAYQACMNMGTLTGAPKIKATELIRQVEQKRRGSYGGAVGYINGDGDMDTCIVIRSAFCRKGQAFIQAGAGVVFDSDPMLEAQETENKARAVITAIQHANQINSETASA